MANVLFISEQKLKSATAVHGNVDPKDLTPAVVAAQDVYVQSLLGSTFYNGLKSRVEAGTETADERYLINNYISPMLANYALYQAFPTLAYKIFNKSILQPTSEESQPATLDQIKYVRDSILNLAEFYRERSREYLIDNESLFAEYQNPDTADGMSPDKQPDYYSGLVIPKNIGCGFYGSKADEEGHATEY
jgi:hypothetical protein